MTVLLDLDHAAITELLEGPDGPVVKDLERRAIRAEAVAKRECPVDTGRLRSSLTHEVTVDSIGPVAVVYTDVSYGPFVELGTRRHGPQPYLRPALKAAADE